MTDDEHRRFRRLVFTCFQLCTMLVGASLTCPPHLYVVRTEEGDDCCPKCPPGNRIEAECTARQSTSCAACDGGTFMDTFTGEKQCHQCLDCTEGTGLREISSCTTREDTVCAPLEGFFCVSGSVDRCVAAQRHSACRPGQYISRAGTSSNDTVCGDCSEGTFSNGTFSSCQVQTQCSWYLQQGTVRSDSVCIDGVTAGAVAGVVTLMLLICGVALYWIKKRPETGTTPVPGGDNNGNSSPLLNPNPPTGSDQSPAVGDSGCSSPLLTPKPAVDPDEVPAPHSSCQYLMIPQQSSCLPRCFGVREEACP
ncbi:tumor necrosis factor receptor superfamily member 14-like [Neosynchiropus ocellatus]